MKFKWRDWLKRNIPLDEVVEKIAGLGVPGFVLLAAIATWGWGVGIYGGAAIVVALAALGGPLGMIGGIGTLVISAFIAAAIAKYGSQNISRRVLKKLKEQGKTKEEILQKIDSLSISRGLRLGLKDYIKNIECEETGRGEEVENSKSSERSQGILKRPKRLDDKDLEQLESRLNKKIEDVKKDLNNRMDRSEIKLKWFICIAVAVGSIITSGIVALIVGFLN